MWCLNLHSHLLGWTVFKGFHPHLEDGTPWMYIGFGCFGSDFFKGMRIPWKNHHQNIIANHHFKGENEHIFANIGITPKSQIQGLHFGRCFCFTFSLWPRLPFWNSHHFLVVEGKFFTWKWGAFCWNFRDERNLETMNFTRWGPYMPLY